MANDGVSILRGVRVSEIGCGTIGALAGRQLVFLGASVTHTCVGRQCDIADGDLPVDWMLGKTRLVVRDVPGLVDSVRGCDAVVVDGVPPEAVVQLEAQRSGVMVVVGAEAERARVGSHGLLAEATTGLVGDVGFVETGPMPLGMALGEITTAVYCAAAVVTGLLRSEGSGQVAAEAVRVSLEASCIGSLDTPVEDIGFGRDVGTFTGRQRRGLFPYGIFSGPDAYIGLAGSWETLVRVMDRPEFAAEEYASYQGRLSAREAITAAIEAWLHSLPSVDDAVAEIGTRGIAERARELPEVWRGRDPALWVTEEGVQTPISPYLITPFGDLERE